MLDFREISERGNSRKKVNQDRVLTCSSGDCGLFAVSDGIGSFFNSELASERITKALRRWWDTSLCRIPHCSIADAADELEELILTVNDELLAQSQKCGATIAVLLVIHDSYAVISAGDSRVYQLDGDGELCQISPDDVWEYSSDLTGGLTPEEIVNSEQRGKLTSAVGVFEDFSPTVSTGTIADKTLFLLMSDGIYKYCQEAELLEIARHVYRSEDIDVGIGKTVSYVYKNGAKDNLSLVMVLYWQLTQAPK